MTKLVNEVQGRPLVHRPYFLSTEELVAVDIDETLILFHDPNKSIAIVEDTEHALNGIVGPKLTHDLEVKDPYGVLGIIYLRKHRPNINLVKKGFARGKRYFAWSRSGALWAKIVVEALDMQQYFELVMAKPVEYIDDTPIANWLPHRTWLPEDFIGWQKD